MADDKANESTPDIQAAVFPEFDYEYSFEFQWMGWRRCLWLQACVRFDPFMVAFVAFGLMFSWGKRIKFDQMCVTNANPWVSPECHAVPADQVTVGPKGDVYWKG